MIQVGRKSQGQVYSSMATPAGIKIQNLAPQEKTRYAIKHLNYLTNKEDGQEEGNVEV